jgi:hypothetical protein
LIVAPSLVVCPSREDDTGWSGDKWDRVFNVQAAEQAAHPTAVRAAAGYYLRSLYSGISGHASQVTSALRLHKLATIHCSSLTRQLGALDSPQYAIVVGRLRALLGVGGEFPIVNSQDARRN